MKDLWKKKKKEEEEEEEEYDLLIWWTQLTKVGNWIPHEIF